MTSPTRTKPSLKPSLVAAGIAIDNTRLHDRVRTISVLDDRERIGRDLHDRVVQRLFAVGMALQGAARLPELDLVRKRIDKVVDDLDATISEIRTTIFELGDNSIPGGLRQAVVGLADECSRMPVTSSSSTACRATPRGRS